MTRNGKTILGSLLAVAIVATGCSAAGPTGATSSPAAAAATEQPKTSAAATLVPLKLTGKMRLEPEKAYVGDTVKVVAEGLPANTELDLAWSTVKGGWVMKGQYQEEYAGRQFTPDTKTLAKVRTDAAGAVSFPFAIPQDYGFNHDVMLMKDGVILNKSAFVIDMRVALSAQRGPVGTPITMDLEGIGWSRNETMWKVLYDNRDAGYFSAVNTRGRASVTIPAAGLPGIHTIQIIPGVWTYAFLNGQEGAVSYKKKFSLTFEVTDGAPVLPPPLAAQSLPVERGSEPAGSGAAVWSDLASGPVGTPITIRGRGLTPDKDVDLVWVIPVLTPTAQSMWAWQETSSKIATVRTDLKGAFTFPYVVPDQVGDTHQIRAMVGQEKLAEGAFKILPSITSFAPTAGPAGTNFKVVIKGMGWRQVTNIYAVNYDNGQYGYVCGFNNKGIVNLEIPASGEPGLHFVNLYPAIFDGTEPLGLTEWKVANLSYAKDHPGENLPGFQVAFTVTK